MRSTYEEFSQHLTYLFNKDTNIYNAVCTKNSIIGFKINLQDTQIWNALVSPKASPDKVSDLFSISPNLDRVAKDEMIFIFFSQYSPISDAIVFYRVLECETHEPQYCGLVDVNTHTKLELDKAITSLVRFRGSIDGE